MLAAVPGKLVSVLAVRLCSDPRDFRFPKGECIDRAAQPLCELFRKKTLAFVCCCHCRFLPTELVEDSHWLPIFNHVTAMRFLGYPCKLRPAQLDAAEGAIHPINYRRLREGLRAVADVAALPLLRWHGSRFQSEIECYR
jgi:hypothetical protein